jgi:predicted phage terminase large subunit-like protein
VYNFDVTGDHNYFAAGVLVHNCIDDPLNPNEAASKTQLQQTNFWIGKTLLSRKVDKAVSVVELVMQRLDEDDPTTLMLDKGGCRHLCFPAELHAGYKVKPASAARYYAGGLFDATRLPKKALDESRKELGDVGYCTPGYSPVLMADWTEKSIEDVKVGDRVVGFVSEPAPKRGKSASRVVKARVVAVQSRHAEVVRMVMASGREVYCTPDHNWWNRFSPGEVAAGRKKMYSPAKIGKRMWSVYQPLDDPTPEQQRDYDWLGGIIDGEGACKHAGSGINIYQSHTANPEVCQKIGETLRRLDLDYSRYKIDTYHASRPGGRQSTVYHLAGDRTTKMRLLKNCKLVKRFQIVRHMWDRPFKVADRKDHVKEIHKVGKMKVHALTTTTGNYVVWGFASSNSGQYGQNPVPPGGAMFDVTQLTLHDAAQPLPRFVKEVRFWDKAATTEKEDSRAAFTTGVRLARTADGLTYVRDVRRGRWNTAVREKVIRTQARRDGSPVDVGLEQEPGSGGKESALKTKRMLRGHRVHVVRPTGDKVQRAVPFSVEVNMGRVVLVPGPWNKEYIRELMHFPFGRFKDQVDASAGANSLLDGGLRKAGGIRSKKKTEEIYDPAPPRKKMVMQDD